MNRWRKEAEGHSSLQSLCYIILGLCIGSLLKFETVVDAVLFRNLSQLKSFDVSQNLTASSQPVISYESSIFRLGAINCRADNTLEINACCPDGWHRIASQSSVSICKRAFEELGRNVDMTWGGIKIAESSPFGCIADQDMFFFNTNKQISPTFANDRVFAVVCTLTEKDSISSTEIGISVDQSEKDFSDTDQADLSFCYAIGYWNYSFPHREFEGQTRCVWNETKCTFEEAQMECNDLERCAGITFEDGGYYIRKDNQELRLEPFARTWVRSPCVVPELSSSMEFTLMSISDPKGAVWHRSHIISASNWCILNNCNFHMMIPQIGRVREVMTTWTHWKAFGYHHKGSSMERLENLVKGQKVLMVQDMLRNIKTEWLMYLDTDVAIVQENVTFKELIEMAHTHVPEGEDCFFIAQEGGCNFNSGFWILKNDERSRKFADVWQQVFRIGYNSFVGDQGCMMETTLRWANSSYDHHCLDTPEWSHFKRTKCWADNLNAWGYDTNHRYFNGVCLLGPDTHKIQFHDCRKHYEKGHFAMHHHGPTVKCRALRSYFDDLPPELTQGEDPLPHTWIFHKPWPCREWWNGTWAIFLCKSTTLRDGVELNYFKVFKKTETGESDWSLSQSGVKEVDHWNTIFPYSGEIYPIHEHKKLLDRPVKMTLSCINTELEDEEDHVRESVLK